MQVKGVFAILLETLYALAALTTIVGLVLEVGNKIHRFANKRRNAQRMERKEMSDTTSENE